MISNAAMILDVAHIGTGSHITGRWYHVTRFRAGRSAFARLEFSQVQHKVQLQEPGKRRADRPHLVPANNSENEAAFRENEQRLKRRSFVMICCGASSMNVRWFATALAPGRRTRRHAIQFPRASMRTGTDDT